jgi:hypothetical protein
MAFREAAEGAKTSKQLAMVRLGDLAAGTGDPATAIGWYKRAGTAGVFGRVARARFCEMDGFCLGSTEAVLKIFDGSGLPGPVRAELLLRAARAEAYQGRFHAAIRLLAAEVRAHGPAGVCQGAATSLCRKILLEAMRHYNLPSAAPSPAEREGATIIIAERMKASEEAVDLYLMLPGWDRGVMGVELAQAAADLAGQMGAPVFGGNILSAVAPEVSAPDLPDHLLRAAELYLEGSDLARARLIVEYAQTRLARKSLGSARWVAAQKELVARLAAGESSGPEPAPMPVAIDAEAIARDVTAALGAVKRARLVIGDAGAESQP